MFVVEACAPNNIIVARYMMIGHKLVTNNSYVLDDGGSCLPLESFEKAFRIINLLFN